MKPWPLVLLSAWGCASELPHVARQKLPRAPFVSPDEGRTADSLALATGRSRPEVRASVEVDAATLPIGKWGPPMAGSFFRLTTDPPEFHIDGARFAEVTVGTFSAFTDVRVSAASWPQCHRAGTAMALWRGLSLMDSGDDSLEVVMTRGPFDYATCTATPRATLLERARAIVPGFVYAVRVDDSVYVVLPHAGFASATRNAAGSGAFSSATLPCVPHRQAAAAMRIAASSLDSWRAITNGAAWVDAGDDRRTELLLSVEVRARGDGNVVSVSAAFSDATTDQAYAPLLAAMKRASEGKDEIR